VIVIMTDIGAGSGFVFTDNGLAATNYRVVESSTKLTVASPLYFRSCAGLPQTVVMLC